MRASSTSLRVFRWKFSLLLIGIALGAAASAEEWVHSTHGFAVQPPAGWTVEEPQDADVVLQVASDRGMFLVFVHERQGRSLQAVRLPMRFHVVMNLDGKLLADKPARVAGLPAWRLDYQARAVGFSDERKRFTRTFFVNGDKLYVLHGVADPDQFPAVLPSFEQMVRSFRPDSGFLRPSGDGN